MDIIQRIKKVKILGHDSSDKLDSLQLHTGFGRYSQLTEFGEIVRPIKCPAEYKTTSYRWTLTRQSMFLARSFACFTNIWSMGYNDPNAIR